MKLLCQTLVNELEQEVRFNLSKRCQLGGVYPYLFMFNSPSGDFTLEMLKDGQAIFSKTFDSQDLKDSLGTTDNFLHVFYPVIPDAPVQVEYGDYSIKLSASGYSATGSSFLGWLQQFEDIQNDMDYTPSDDTQNSLAIRFKEYKEGAE